ncbi:hypothetical protein [Micromonospora cathayae]|uniref:Peptidase inhibitor family I36 n=1 Tax=Micromonospora cathayae TaxID=3028804 RepID=A0ABY7ZXS4_9ACTN|nr:hypothetical protein [Micromonospora sp. HUAS 3]WDZ87703.1 hypothetical protein PVK37_15500 [Micromonospora sp. HUAS 3]
MRKVTTGLAAAGLATLGLLAAVPGSAAASAPAPFCESGASTFICDAASTGATTWTITERYIAGGSSTYSMTTAGSFLFQNCTSRSTLRVFYSYVADGVTVTSETGGVNCNPYEWP